MPLCSPESLLYFPFSGPKIVPYFNSSFEPGSSAGTVINRYQTQGGSMQSETFHWTWSSPCYAIANCRNNYLFIFLFTYMQQINCIIDRSVLSKEILHRSQIVSEDNQLIWFGNCQSRDNLNPIVWLLLKISLVCAVSWEQQSTHSLSRSL